MRYDERNKDALVRLAHGFATAYRFMNDQKNHGEVMNIVKESLKISDDTARQIFRPYTEADKNVLPRQGELDLQAFDRGLALDRGRYVIRICRKPITTFGCVVTVSSIRRRLKPRREKLST